MITIEVTAPKSHLSFEVEDPAALTEVLQTIATAYGAAAPATQAPKRTRRKTRRGNRPWTTEEWDQLRDFVNDDYTGDDADVAAFAEQLGRTSAAVRSAITRLDSQEGVAL